MSSEHYIVAVDSGGTFSDCCVISHDGRYWTGKSPSTPPNFEEGVLGAAADAASRMGLTLEELLSRTRIFGHGTTVATNALVTRSGCKTALITTQGHEDAILIGRVHQKVAGLSNWQIRELANLKKADPIVPKPLIKGVVERVDCFGQVVVPLDEKQLDTLIDEILAEDVEAVAIGLLWSFKNQKHERRIRERLLERKPDLFVSISGELAPVLGEYERIATTVVNAYVSKLTQGYLEKLRTRLREAGLTGQTVVMQSSGGTATIEQVLAKPVALLASGPAGGVVGSLAQGQRFQHKNIVTSDVGGTTFDVGLIIHEEPVLAAMPVFSQYHLALPMIEINSIGAGGGSIAWIQKETGLLKVGPKSAGALPGPACYARGGTEATVTDANVVLGRLNPDYFLGGKGTLDVEKAKAAIQPLADQLGLSLEDTALGIIDIADAQMGDLVRKMTIQKGHDPRDFALYGFGGAGPLQVCGYTRGTGINDVVIPSLASVFSAYGIAQSDLLAVAEASLPMPMPGDATMIENQFTALVDRAMSELTLPEGMDPKIVVQREAYLCYAGQNHDIGVGVKDAISTAEQVEGLVADFEAKYESLYGSGTTYRSAGIMLNTLRVCVVAELGLPELAEAEMDYQPSEANAHRSVYYREYQGWHDTPIYRLNDLADGFVQKGPIFIESDHTTVYVAPDFEASVDGLRNVYLRPCEPDAQATPAAAALATD